jgi:hypothetical protein
MADWSTVELDGLARVGVGGELRRFSPAVRYPGENNGIFATRFARGVDGRRMVLEAEEERTPGQLVRGKR